MKLTFVRMWPCHFFELWLTPPEPQTTSIVKKTKKFSQQKNREHGIRRPYTKTF
jgi:hypothetical protein